MNEKVLDVAQANPSAGTRVVMWSKHDSGAANQLWYEDRNGAIHSKLSDLTLDTTSKSGHHCTFNICDQVSLHVCISISSL